MVARVENSVFRSNDLFESFSLLGNNTNTCKCLCSYNRGDDDEKKDEDVEQKVWSKSIEF